MSQGAMETALRSLLAKLARSAEARFVGRPPDRPNRWYPGRVPDAEGYGMTDAAAWELIGMALEDRAQAMKLKTLDKPPGVTAYEMIIKLPHHPEKLYVKFEFLVPNNVQKICGRSFHLEDPR